MSKKAREAKPKREGGQPRKKPERSSLMKAASAVARAGTKLAALDARIQRHAHAHDELAAEREAVAKEAAEAHELLMQQGKD